MNYALILVPVCTLLLGYLSGYLLGRHQSDLIDKIRTLQEKSREKPLQPEKPTVTMGVYQPPQSFGTEPDKRPTGLVETKTPELLRWENEIAVENEVLGRK